MTGTGHDETDEYPLVGIVILNWNDGPRTVACAESVLRSTYGRFFVVLVDNGSTDGSRDVIGRWVDDQGEPVPRAPEAASASEEPGPSGRPSSRRLLSVVSLKSNGGYGAGNNAGMTQALSLGADAVWVLNNDTIVDPEALAEVVRVLRRNRRTGLAGSCVINDDERGLVQCLGGGTYGRWTSRTRPAQAGTDPDMVSPNVELDFICGCAMLISAECVRQIGGFEEGFFLYCEEVDFTRRAAAVGWGMAVAERAIVRHVHGASAGSNADVTHRSARSFFYGARSAVLLARKADRVTLPSVVLARIAFAVTLGLRGNLAASRFVARGVRSGLQARAWSSAPPMTEVPITRR